MFRVSHGLLLVEMSLAVIVLACAGAADPSGVPEGRPSLPATPSARWHLSFQYSGGIAGLDRRATVSSTGQATFHDLRSGRESATTLTAGETQRLGQLVYAGDPLAQKEDQRTASCRDCLTYTLDVQLGDRRRRILADDQGLAETLRPLVGWLVERTNRALQVP